MPIDHHTSLSARHFPNVSSGGYYSPHNLSITLQTPLPNEGMDNSAARESWFRDNLPLIIHEYQHGLDHIGTVCGRKLLDSLRQSYHALSLKLDHDESGLHRWVNFHDLQKRFHRRAYFTENDPTYATNPGERPNWSWNVSVGRAFDLDGRPDISDPIVFLRFTDVDRDLHVARQPFTAAALFEARSMAVELEQSVIQNLTTFGEDESSWQAFNNLQQAMFYDVDLTLYSTPVHFLSARIGISDPLPAYRFTAVLSWIALNITDDLELNPNLPDGWEDADGDMPVLAENLIKRRDPGFLFFVLASHAEPPADLLGSADQWLSQTLQNAGFPPIADIVASASRFLDVPDADARSVPFDKIYWQVASNGAVNFRRLADQYGLMTQELLLRLGSNRGPVALPNTLVSNTILSPTLGGKVEPFMSIADQEGLGELEKVLADHMQEFMLACR